MCTVSFLPIENRGYLLTSNRDESIKRPAAIPPLKKKAGNNTIICPIDSQAQGTWIATNNAGRSVCLMNGAFSKHTYAPPYRKSRGLIVLDTFLFDDVNSFANSYDVTSIEPFTIIWIDNPITYDVTLVKWNGHRITLKSVDSSQPLIWSSVTLYDKKMILQREKWFSKWLSENSERRIDSIRDFHHFGGIGDLSTDIKMKIPGKVATVSITSVQVNHTKAVMHYEDILKNKTSTITL